MKNSAAAALCSGALMLGLAIGVIAKGNLPGIDAIRGKPPREAAAGENDKAEQFFQRALAAALKDDDGQAQIGAWYIRTGRRDKGEELFAQAFARNPDEVWHYVRAAEALLNVPAR